MNVNQRLLSSLSTLRSHTTQNTGSYVAGIAFALAAFALSVIFADIIRDSRFVFYLAAVVFSAWYGGFGPGLLTTVLCITLTNIFPDMRVLRLFTDPQDLIQVTIFTLVAFMVSYLEEARSRTARELAAARDQLEIILNGVADGITAQDEKEQFIFANKAAADMLGFESPSAMQAMDVQDVRARYISLDENGLPIRDDAIPSRRALRTGQRVQQTIHLTHHATGEQHWLIVTSTPVLDEQGRPRQAVNILRDITERRQADEERTQLNALLEYQRQRQQNIVANVPGVIWEAHVDQATQAMKLTFVSDYVEHLFGYTAREATSHPNFFGEVVHPDDLKTAIDAVRAIYEGSGSGVVTFRAAHKAGHTVDVEAHLTVIIENGQPVGTRGVMMDVSERQRNERALERYARMLRRSNEELQQFAYIASHDLQEPLRMVTSYLQLLERRYEDQLDDDAREFIGYAVDGAARMKALINDLLTYSRVDRDEKAFAPVSAQRALDQALDNLEIAISESAAQITHDTLPTVLADEGQLVQLLQNLVGNAIKFRSDQRPTQVHIGAQRDGAFWQFCVRDNGIGIEAAYLERIFVVFQRLHSAKRYSGTGIGLAICKKVVERHGGRIWVESTPGEGTTFYFTLPAA